MAVAVVPCPVMKMTGTLGATWWIRRNTSRPDWSGRSTSRITTSGRSNVTRSNPSAADVAVTRWVSGPGKARRKKWRIDSSSSITSRVGTGKLLSGSRGSPGFHPGGAGKRSTKQAPPSGRFEATRSPPWSSAIRRETVRPRPRPDCLPLTNGSKTRGRSDGAIPGPLSETRSSTQPWWGVRSSISSDPPLWQHVERVHGQVQQQLLELVRIPFHHDGGGRPEELQGDLPLLDAAPDQRERLIDEGDQVHAAALGPGRPGEVEERLEGALHPADLLLDDAEIVGRQAARTAPP